MHEFYPSCAHSIQHFLFSLENNLMYPKEYLIVVLICIIILTTNDVEHIFISFNWPHTHILQRKEVSIEVLCLYFSWDDCVLVLNTGVIHMSTFNLTHFLPLCGLSLNSPIHLGYFMCMEEVGTQVTHYMWTFRYLPLPTFSCSWVRIRSPPLGLRHWHLLSCAAPPLLPQDWVP